MRTATADGAGSVLAHNTVGVRMTMGFRMPCEGLRFVW